MSVEEIKRMITPILTKHGIKKAAFFGSSVRGELQSDSDIDILVEIEQKLSLFGFIALKLEIEEALGRKVDLVEYDTIKPNLKDYILSEQVVIF